MYLLLPSLRVAALRVAALSVVALCAAVALGIGTLGGCGPSLRSQQRGTEYFERCQAADRDSKVSETKRRACWARWLDYYTENQSKDRLRYAHMRARGVHPQRRTSSPPPVPPRDLNPPDQRETRNSCIHRCNRINRECREACPSLGDKDDCMAACKMEYNICTKGCL